MERSSSVRRSVTSPVPQEQLTSSGGRHDVHNTNMATYNHMVDSSIFALDDAAAQCDNIDDLLSDFGVSLSQIIGSGSQVQGQGQGADAGRPPSRQQQQSDAASTSDRLRKSDFGSGEVEVKAMQRKLPDGRTVLTRVTRGPVKHVKRIVKISRETPEGPQLIASFETTPDTDVSHILNSVPLALGMSLGHHVTTATCPETQLASSGAPALTANNGSAEMDKSVDTAVDMPNEEDDVIEEQLPLNYSDTESPPKSPPIAPSNRLAESLNASNIFAQAFFRAQIKRPSSIYSADITEDMTHYETEEDTSCWTACLKRTCHVTRRPVIKLRHGLSGMTAADMDESVLPTGMTGLVVTYARMLLTDRAKFIETLFRSVKLNRLDVVRVLCKIVSKSGLSHVDMREPESSATVLHVALLYNHPDVVRYLLGLNDRALILATYTTEQYRNQTSLHVAVANGNLALVDALLSALAPEDRVCLINTVADGKYFLHEHPHGQLCLTAAAWAGNGDVIKTLARHGADLSLRNLKGNTLLHSIIKQASQCPRRLDYSALFTAVWEAAGVWAGQRRYDATNAHEKKLEQEQVQIDHFRFLLSIRNDSGHTPLTLAASRSPPLLKHMIEMEKIYKIPQNKLGSIAWVTYDVTDITSYAHGSYNKFSILHILAHNSQRLSRKANLDADTDYDPLEMEPIRTMVLRKWRVYRWVYIMSLVVHLVFMVTFTSCTLGVNSRPEGAAPSFHSPHLSFAVFLPLPLLNIIMEVIDLCGTYPYRAQFMRGRGVVLPVIKSVKSQWTITGNGPYRLVNLAFSAATVVWYQLYCNQHRWQELALAIALLLGWIYVLFFTRACRVTCRFAIMIQKMFFRDLIYFMTVYALILVGFSFAMNAMYAGNAAQDTSGTMDEVFYDMMNIVLNLVEKQHLEFKSRYPNFTRLILIFYAIVAVILLINMLIAMMNTSYETVRVTRANLWRQQQLSIMLMFERRFYWLRPLCRRSERDVWRRTANDNTTRSYVDVTTLHGAYNNNQ